MGSALGRIEVEQPAYRVLKKTTDYEIRRYPPTIRAQVQCEGSQDLVGPNGFRDLANFIFGGNRSRSGETAEKIAMTAPVITEKVPATSEKIAMTAPVITEQSTSGGVQMAFILPSKYTSLQQLPVPNDPKVQLIEVPATTFAAIQFSGTPGQSELDEKTERLKQALSADENVQMPSDSRTLYCRYNPPWTPGFLRTNEILLSVDYKE